MSRTKHPWHSEHATGRNIPTKLLKYMKGNSNPKGGCTVRHKYDEDDNLSYKDNRPEQNCESSRERIMRKYYKRKVRNGIKFDSRKQIEEMEE